MMYCNEFSMGFLFSSFFLFFLLLNEKTHQVKLSFDL